jgi:glycosyltransferase involved in cell wall biosynthesis
MTPRRLLILCYFYPPLAGGGVHRVLSFSRYLPRHGWSCTVVCAGANDYWVRDDSLVERIPQDTHVVRVEGGSALSAWLKVRGGDRGKRPGPLFSGLRSLSNWWLFPDSYAGWARQARRAAARLLAEDRYDAILTSSPPDSVHMAGRRLRASTGLPWIVDFRDPWVGLYFRKPPTAWHRARHARMERAVLEEADVVLAASRTHADAPGAASGAKPRSIVHLPNGFEPIDADACAGATLDVPENSFAICFTGTLSLMPDTEVFLEAVDEVLADRPEARRRLRVRLAGPYDLSYEDRSLALGLKGIVGFPGPLSHAQSRALQRRADLLMLWKPRGYPTMVPGKLYEYLDAGRPLLAVLPHDDESAELVRRSGGEVVAPGDRTALAQAIARRYDAWRQGQATPTQRPDWLGSFERAAIAERLAVVLNEAVEARS